MKHCRSGWINFEEIAEVKVDSKNRISLGRKVRYPAKHYRVHQESSTGKILKDIAIIAITPHP